MTDTKLAAAMLRIYAGQQREIGRETYAAEIEAVALALEQPVGDCTCFVQFGGVAEHDPRCPLALAAAHVPSGMVLVPEAKLRDWAWRLERDMRRGHQCDVARNAESVMQSIAAVIAAAQGDKP